LRAGFADRIAIHTCTVTEFLRATDERISRYVLLDHMDWMSTFYPGALAEEWRAILERAAPGARVIFRSAHADPAYLGTLRVAHAGGTQPLTKLLHFQREFAARLQREDRVHTYAGFHIADVCA
jgi:S-adenosylmethionine-diacylglycerol 3-amino-3-carboxypropyl transferase